MSDTIDSETIDPATSADEAQVRRLVRPTDGRWLGGVAAGLGRYFDVNPLVYRIAFAALALVGGTGILLYLAAWLVIPGEHDDESIAVEALRQRRDQPWLLAGVGLLAFGALFALSEARFWPGTGNVWLAATLVGGAIVWWHVSNRPQRSRPEPAPAAPGVAASTTPSAAVPPAPRPPARPSLFAPVLGALLATAGLFGLLAVLDVYDVDLAVALAAGVAIVGVAIAVGAMTQRRVGGLVVLGLILLAGFGVAALTPVSVSSGVGEKVERPVTSLQRNYELGVGNLQLDLTEFPWPSATTTAVDASVGVGHLVITVPADVGLEVDARSGAGEVDILGATDDGVGAHRTISLPGPGPDVPILDLDLDVGIGNVEVRRA
jgi:phage shock protein PspC (stress-responsive transcriptional regulator)